MQYHALGKTEAQIPRIVFGTSCLGNLYEALSSETKLAISREWFSQSPSPVAIDTAGKYGAGLALETIGNNLRELSIEPSQIVISNKLGWKRIPLRTPEPTFEPGVWADLQYDAEQCINYDGILECWEQGNELLGAPYRPQLVSVHDPDEYLSAADSETDRQARMHDLLEAYRALQELKQQGEVHAIGIGAKDWRIIAELDKTIDLDWVMLANSLTILKHPPEVIRFVDSLLERGIGVINSAVFNAGFSVGGRFLDYRLPDENDEADRQAFQWRNEFLLLCKKCDVQPAAACVQFALSPPGVIAVSLNTSAPERISQNVALVENPVPEEFWVEAKRSGLIDADFPHLN